MNRHRGTRKYTHSFHCVCITQESVGIWTLEIHIMFAQLWLAWHLAVISLPSEKERMKINKEGKRERTLSRVLSQTGLRDFLHAWHIYTHPWKVHPTAFLETGRGVTEVSEGVGTRCTEWVWRSGWADPCCVTHQTPCRGGLVQVQRRRAAAKWSGAASESSNLVCERGRAHGVRRGPRGRPAKLCEGKIKAAAASFSRSILCCSKPVRILSKIWVTIGWHKHAVCIIWQWVHVNRSLNRLHLKIKKKSLALRTFQPSSVCVQMSVCGFPDWIFYLNVYFGAWQHLHTSVNGNTVILHAVCHFVDTPSE